MGANMEPLRAEHRELLPEIEKLLRAADAIESEPVGTLEGDIDAAYEFLTHHLIPHAQAEDAALYPMVARVIDPAETTATMSRDHVAVVDLVKELASLRSELRAERLSDVQVRGLRRVLYGLYTLIRVHFAKEEEIYLPILEERLFPEDAREMLEAMDYVMHRKEPSQEEKKTISSADLGEYM